MTRPMILGLNGVAGAGKDTTFDRLRALGGPVFQRFSIADPMKESMAAFFDVTLGRLEELKRDPEARVIVRTPSPSIGVRTRNEVSMTMREAMQRYGTEAHRGVFGDDFWLDFWFDQVDARQRLVEGLMGEPCCFVNTSVRFPNEAERIRNYGGEIWTIVGPQDDGAAGHESEIPLPPALVDRYVDNSVRAIADGLADGNTIYAHLDDQIALILSEWSDR